MVRNAYSTRFWWKRTVSGASRAISSARDEARSSSFARSAPIIAASSSRTPPSRSPDSNIFSASSRRRGQLSGSASTLVCSISTDRSADKVDCRSEGGPCGIGGKSPAPNDVGSKSISGVSRSRAPSVEARGSSSPIASERRSVGSWPRSRLLPKSLPSCCCQNPASPPSSPPGGRSTCRVDESCEIVRPSGSPPRFES